jgi:NADH-quinone oxidoreductase subunit L
MIHTAFLIPLLPLCGFVILLLFGRRLGDPVAGWVATALVAASFVVTLITFAGLVGLPSSERHFIQPWFTWISTPTFHSKIALLIDPLSIFMALFVTGVSALIHLYSIGYMKKDPEYHKFFVYMNLFVFSMLMLVLADNLLLCFLGWEGVGLCSYLLIAFWYGRDSAASAGKKAFIYNRIGDTGFLIAMFLIFEKLKTLNYLSIFSHVNQLSPGIVTAIVLLLFLAATGKSAQIPLFPWLPDAMEGPTPVSALIHAATMVTAGVYLMVRFSPLLHLTPDARWVIAVIGVVTAFVAATIACAQNDIKKILAYSTVSQLGYMFLAVGSGAYVAAMFLMIAHAFYKALLFLGAGSVIHGMGDAQDVKRMGGLRRFMPITYATFLVAWFGIAGIPPFVGFWAKGSVLVAAFEFSPILWVLGAITAILTAYYIGRGITLTFLGKSRWEGANGNDLGSNGFTPHESPRIMLIPLYVLSVCVILGGFINLPFHPSFVFLSHWFIPVLYPIHLGAVGVGGEWALSLGDVVLALTGVWLALHFWRVLSDRPALEPRFLQLGWYVDKFYDRAVANTGTELASQMSSKIEVATIDGAVNGVPELLGLLGGWLRKAQTGFVRSYALAIALGLFGLLIYIATRATL